MQEQSKSASERQAEVLEWMGTAYGRRRAANSAAPSKEVAVAAIANANSSTASRPDRLAGYLAAMAGYKRGVTAGLAGLLALVIAVALIQVRGSASLPVVTQTATSTQTSIQEPAPVEPGPVQLSNAVPRVEFEQAAREAEQRLASEHEARIALEGQVGHLEGQVGQLSSELAAQKLNRENAEQANAATSVALAAERKARAEAEETAKSSKEELARMASSAAVATVAAVPAPPQPTQAEVKPVETHSPPWEASVRVVNASVDVGANSDAATSALVQGERLFAKGDVEEARQRFELAARMGMPEAALALGNTYDRVSLAKAGLSLTGDPMRARQWYRRALELAQIHPEPRQQ